MVDLPPLLVFPDKYDLAWRGAFDTDRGPYRKDKDDVCPPRDLVDAKGALTKDWPTDAHCAMYAVPGEDAAPRIAKTAVRGGVIEPVLRWIIVDVDTPDHVPVTEADEWLEAQLDLTLEIPECLHALIWQSRGGIKIAWPLAKNRQYTVQKGEDYLQMFHAYLVDNGLDVDESCKDWTRLMRLPRTVRDGELQEYQVYGWDSVEPLDWKPPREPNEKPTTRGSARSKSKDSDAMLKARVREALAFVNPDCAYERWISVGFAIKTAFGASGFSIWHAWSKTGEGYPGEDEIKDKWDKLAGDEIEDGVTLRSVFHYAREGGWCEDMDTDEAQDVLERCTVIPDYFTADALQAAVALRKARGAGWSLVVEEIKRKARVGSAPRFSDWEKAIVAQEKDLDRARKIAEAQLKQKEADSEQIVTNFDREYIEGEEVRYKKPMCEIVDTIMGATGDWPRLLDNVLFAPARDGVEGADYFQKSTQFFAWLESETEGVQWTDRELLVDEGGRVRPISESKTFEGLAREVDPEYRYRSVETIPHVPRIKRAYYFDRDLPEPTGEMLDRYLSLFNPATKWDRYLIESLILTGMVGLPPGKRPAFVITSDHGRGSGKTSTAQAIARLYGGVIGIKASDGWDKLQQRLLDPSTAHKRYCLIDNLKNRLSSAEFEAMITERVINGKRMYVGDGERVNLLTWIFTANTPSLSNDLASRSVVIKVGAADHSIDFEAEINEILTEHKDQLISDIRARLQEPDSGQVVHHFDRWQAWQRSVLSRFEEADRLAEIIQKRRGEVDDDATNADRWYEAIRSRLKDPDNIKTVIPSGELVQIAREIEQDRTLTVQRTWDLLRDVMAVGSMKNTKKHASSYPCRGLFWLGKNISATENFTEFENARKKRKNNSGWKK